jgi:poly(3-hydroxybutyrate) depolymerase
VGQEPDLVKDVRFIAELIDKLKASYNIDAKRIYANGFSNGGGMAFVLSCTLSDRIAAVGMVGAAQTLPWGWCTDRRPVPAILFHGTADPFAPYNGGISPIAPDTLRFPNITTWTAKWAVRNRCASTPIDSTFASGVTRHRLCRRFDRDALQRQPRRSSVVRRRGLPGMVRRAGQQPYRCDPRDVDVFSRASITQHML